MNFIQLTKQQKDQFPIVLERNKNGDPSLVLNPVEIENGKFFISEEHLAYIEDNTPMKRPNISLKQMTREEIKQKQDILLGNSDNI